MAEGVDVDAEPVLVPTSLGRVAVRVLGDGRPTLLWHAMFVDGASWDAVVPRIAAGRRLLVVDGPGFGRSEPLRSVTSIAASVAVAAELLRVLAPDGPVDWVGNAWGGHVGLELAATRPDLVRSLAAISAPPQPIDARLRMQILLLVPLLRAAGPTGPVRTAVLEALLTDASRARPDLVRGVTDALRGPGRRSLAKAVQSFVLRRADVTGLLADIEAPTLFVAGDDRGDWSPEEMRRTALVVPTVRTAVVPGARTLVPLEQPDALAELLLDFWGSPSRAPEAQAESRG